MKHKKGGLRRYGAILAVFAILFPVSNATFAEVDPAVLTEILSQLSGGESADSSVATASGVSDQSTTTNTSSSAADTKTDMKSMIIQSAGNNATTSKSNPPLINSSIKVRKVEIGDKKVTVTFGVINDSSGIRKFGFDYTDGEGKTRTSTTYAKESIKNANGDYVWYIPNLALTKYSISLAGLTEAGKKASWVAPANFEADFSLRAAGRCIIPDVSDLRVISKPETSVLHWKKIPEAVAYRVYKKDSAWTYGFVAETKKNSYTIYVSNGSAKYEQFKVKALCSDGSESLRAPDIRVRTGPSELIFLSILSVLIGGMIVRKRKKSFEKRNIVIQ